MNSLRQIANCITDLGFPCSVIDGETGSGEIELEVRDHYYHLPFFLSKEVDLLIYVATPHLYINTNICKELFLLTTSSTSDVALTRSANSIEDSY